MDFLKPLLNLFTRGSSPPSTKTLNDLDDYALLLIFDRLTPHDLLCSAALVSHRWSDLVRTACRRRRSLTLLVGSRKWYRSIESTNPALDELVNDDGIRAAGWWSNYALVHKVKWPQYYTQLDARTCDWLVTTFPNINTLRIAQNGVSVDTAEPLFTLLRSWKSKLVTLKLMAFYKRESFNRRQANHFYILIKTINGLPELKHLSLDIFHRIEPLPELTVLERLHSFSFYSRDHIDVILKPVLVYARTNSNLQSIGIKNTLSHLDVNFTPTILEMSPELARRFTELRIESPLPLVKLEAFCTKFTNLKIFLLRLRHESMAEVIRAMLPLQQLLCLHLTMEYPLELAEEDVTSGLPQLPSVQGLSLTLKLNSHVEIENLAIEQVFPSISILGLSNRIRQCDCCGINTNRRLGALWIKKMFCTRRLVAPLKKCPALQRVYSDQQMFWRFDSKIQVVNRDVFEV